MAEETPIYDVNTYTQTNVEYGEPFELDLTDPARVLESTGINVGESVQQEDDLYTNPIIKEFTKGNVDGGLKVYTGMDINTFGTYKDMLKTVGLGDKSGPLGTNQALAKGALTSLLGVTGIALGGSGEFGFGQQLKGPTGKQVFSVGGLSEKALQRHFENFSQVQEANLNKDLLGLDIKNTDTGFAMTIDNFHFSRKPGQMFFDGHKGHLSSDDGNAHAMQKSIEALSKGLDPAGYRLDGENENNGGAAGGSSAGGRVTEDGYYTYVANNSFGYTKSVLYGGNLSDKLAQEFGTDGMTLAKAMQLARADKNLTVTQALKNLTSGEEETSTNEEETSTDIFDLFNVNRKKVSTVSQESKPDSGSTYTSIKESVPSQTFDKSDRPSGSGGFSANIRAKESGTVKGRGMNLGGQVGQLANMLRQTRLGMNLGGQPVSQGLESSETPNSEEINVNEMGFVGDKTPDQVTPKQSIADNRPMNVREDDFLINSPAIEQFGIRNIANMISRGLEAARDAGVEIVDIPVDIPKQQLVKILASDSEFRVPKNLVPFIGLDTLNRINDRGKPVVEQRTRLT